MRRPRLATLLLAAAMALCGASTGTAAGDGKSDCNPYFPLRAGAQWVYREGPLGGKPRVEKLIRVESEEGEGDRRSAVLEQTVRTPGAPGLAAGRARTLAHCDHGRIGLTVQGAARGSDGDRTAEGTVVARIPGLPPADKLVPGYEWTSHSSIQASDDGVQTRAEGERESRVAGRETVSVPAGRFVGALKIVSIETLRQQGQERSARQELVEWYASGVGLVKRETRVRTAETAATSVEVLASSSLVTD